jgi:hypothetical protein
MECSWEEVPDWAIRGCSSDIFQLWEWVQSQGYAVIAYSSPPGNQFLAGFHWGWLEGLYAIVSVPSQKFAHGRHAVIGQWQLQESGVVRFQIVHDPNPENEPYEQPEISYVYWLVPKPKT